MLLSEILIFLCSISSKKDLYLEKVGDFDDNPLCEVFFQIIEKYMIIETDAVNQSRSMMQDKSMISCKHDKDKSTLIQIIKDNDAKIANLKQYIETLEKSKASIELKYNDKEREIEMLKKSQSNNYQIQEQLINNTIAHSELRTEINEKNIEIEELKKEISLTNDRAKEKIKKLTESLELAKDKIADFETKQLQYDKLTIKYKELQTVAKSKGYTKEEMTNVLEEKNKAIDILMKEKKTLLTQIEKLNKDILAEKEKSTKMDFEKRKLEYEISDMKSEINKIKEREIEKQKTKMNNPNDSQKDISEIGYAIEGMLDTSKDGNKITAEFLTMKSNSIGLNANDDFIQKLKDDNVKLCNQIDLLKEKNENLTNENQMAEINIQKLDLDKQKLTLAIDRLNNRIKNLETENTILNEKIKNFEIQKKKEIQQALKSKTELIEKMLTEKKNIIIDYEKLQKEFENYKKTQEAKPKDPEKKTARGSGGSKAKDNNQIVSTTSGSIQHISNSEVLELKNEIQNLKLQHLQKDEQIRKLQEKLEEMENVTKENTLSEDEINTKLADLDFYKKSYEEQKARVNKEHELISESLYKLAVHFMSLKDNLQKKMKK